MNNVLITDIPHKIANAFFLSSLKFGGSLSQELLKILNFKEGHFFSITAKSADVSKLDNLESEEILPQHPFKTIETSDSSYRTRRRVDSYTELSKFLRFHLKKDDSSHCIFEEVSFEKGDECLRNSKAEIKYLGKEVYYFLSHNKNSENILHKYIKQADAMWHYMNIITSSEFEIKKDEFSLDDIKMLAANASHVILGAYDMEGYVCWEKKHS